MRPLSALRPKVLLPVAGRPLVDHAVDRLRTVTDDVAVNAHAAQPSLVDHLEAAGVRASVEDGPRLGTAGALGALVPWIDGRPVVVVNGDTWCPGGLAHLVAGWDGTSIRILVPGGGPFGPSSPVAGALMPWEDVRGLAAEPSGLWEVSWRDALARGRVEAVAHEGPWIDCADPADYLEANLAAAGGSWIDPAAEVDGLVEESVVWDGAVVHEREHLRRAIRTDAKTTVLVRRDRVDRASTGRG